ncbi:MAG: urea ABC transporter permease subunit UrtB [Hyphomicrobiales bacterium]|nr:urea ABC transporter permease subunit UrtB [Hyphomicrobiales bacterium]
MFRIAVVSVSPVSRALRAGLGAIVALLICAAPASAGHGDEALARFTTDRFADTAEGIKALVASHLATKDAILQALGEGRLYFDPVRKQVYFKDIKGRLDDAKTGAPAAGVTADALKTVRVSNLVRSALQDARGSTGLTSSDPAKRLAAAHDAFRSHDPAALAAIDAALAKEKSPQVRRALAAAGAAIIALNSKAADQDRLQAVAVIGKQNDAAAISLLSQLRDGPKGDVQAAAASALARLQMQAAVWSGLQNIWYGLSYGSVLLLAAVGLAITFGVIGVINMAHGEMVMLGAYTTYVVQQWLDIAHPDWLGASLFIAIPAAFIVSGLVGMAIERGIIRFLYGRPLETLLATFGLSLILQQAVRTLFGADNRDVVSPYFMRGTFPLGGLSITFGRMWIIVFALLVFAALQLVLRATPFGLKIRAVTQNRRMASAMGIDTNRIDALAFGLGSGIAGIAGVALSQIDNVSPNLGQSYIIDSFMVVVFGGVGNLWGTMVAAMSLGVANKLIEPFVGAVLGKIIILVLLILFIQRRPRGLFALKGRAVEA